MRCLTRGKVVGVGERFGQIMVAVNWELYTVLAVYTLYLAPANENAENNPKNNEEIRI